MLHLLNDEMVDFYLDSPRRDPAIRKHIQECEDCQAKVREHRYFRITLGARFEWDPPDHVSSEMLAAFCEEKLDDQQTHAVMDHLRSCAECREAFGALHAILGEALEPEAAAQQAVPEYQVQRVLDALPKEPVQQPPVLARLGFRQVREEIVMRLRELLAPDPIYDKLAFQPSASYAPERDPLASKEDFTESLSYSPKRTPEKRRLKLEAEFDAFMAEDSRPIRKTKIAPPDARQKRHALHALKDRAAQKTTTYGRLVEVEMGAGRVSIALRNPDNWQQLFIWVEPRSQAILPLIESDSDTFLVATVSCASGEQTVSGTYGQPLAVDLPADVTAIRISSALSPSPVELRIDSLR